ncbi:MAG: Na/Pi cotransporter family protein [Oscillospiraceae bacterium]|nr:Na/Pi cotransporter family protein [Oscillospiraceae bacterium]
MGFGNIATLLSGLGLLLYGIKILGEGLELAAGAKLKVLLEKMTSNRFAAVLVGFVITTLIQSSSTTTVMVVGFVNTGIMNLTQAIGVIMGANIGTTTTSILVSLDIGKYAPIAIGIGVFLSMLTKKTTKKHIGLAITGFGMLFLGMTLMKDAMEPLASSPVFSEWLMNANNPFVAILIGTVITAVIQSSAASIGILQALASQGLIPLHFAAYVIYGQNIGTCITALISSIGTKKNSKRTAVMHVLFNVFGTVIFIILTKLLPFTDWIESLTDNTMMQLSLVHIIFNVVSTLIMFPFADKVLVKLACLIVPDKKDSSEDNFKLQFVDNLMINTPPFAVAQVSKEVHRMAGLARQNFSIAAEDLLNKSCDHFDEVQHTEEVINFLNHNITPILVKINSLDLSYSDAKYIGRVFHVINDIERIGDHAQNLEEAAKSRVDEGIEISAEGERELREMYETTLKLIDGSIEAFTSQILDNEKAEQLSEYEASVDDMQTEFEQSHIERLNAHKCNTRAGMLFINTITDFERVADHATNIAWSVSKKPKNTSN